MNKGVTYIMDNTGIIITVIIIIIVTRTQVC